MMRFFILALLCLDETLGANILGIWFHAGKSHHILGEVLLKELARRGHNITMASPFPLEKPFPNYTDVYLSGIREDQASRAEIFMQMNKGGAAVAYQTTVALTRAQSELTLAHPEMKKLLESGTKFDIIIMDWFLNGAVLYFGKLFKAPIILSASSGTNVLTTAISGNPYPPSYVPISDFPVEMTFLQRVMNGILAVIGEILRVSNIVSRYHEDLVKKHFNDTFTNEDMKDVVALMLSNGHYAYETPRPYVPNVIPVGGFHILPPKRLPKNFQKFMDEAEEGVIYFSLGSNMKSTLLPDNTKQDLLKVFSKLPYRIIWKWEDENLGMELKNVLISKWCPQNDILAHPKLKLFISHGGLLSTIESIHYGIPVIGIPIFGDQKLNIPIAVRNGYALQINLEDLNEETLTEAIKEILHNPKYKREAEKRSLLLRDRPLSAMDTAVFWVEHIIRHKGGEHLKTYGLKQPLYQYLMLDVILFVTVIILTTLYIMYYLIRKIYCVLMKTIVSERKSRSKKIQ